jgi:hypothetical protein
MAQPTTEHHVGAPQQQASQNVVRQGAQPAAAPVERLMPVLFDDLDPVLLVRLYPEEMQTDAARARAMDAGNRVREEGEHLVASQQEPVLIEGEPVRHPSDAPARQRPPATLPPAGQPAAARTAYPQQQQPPLTPAAPR